MTKLQKKILGLTNFKWLVSVDSGNGLTKGFSVKGDGTCLSADGFLSTRAIISAEKFSDLGGLTTETDIWYWQGQYYALGEDVTKYPNSIIEGNMGVGRYGNDFHQMLVAASILNLTTLESDDTELGDIELILYLPPSIFNAEKENVKAAFMGKHVEIDVKRSNGTEHSARFNYANVRVLPEAIGAVFVCLYDNTGKLNPALAENLMGQTAVIDIGNYTTDALRVLDGKFDPTSISRATHQDFGVASMIKDPILSELQAAGYPHLTSTKIDLAITDGTYQVKPNKGRPFGIRPKFEDKARQLAQRVASEIIQRDFKNFEDMNGCFLIGGGGKIVRPYLSQMYPAKIFSLEDMGFVDETDVNALGGLRFVMSRYFHKQ